MSIKYTYIHTYIEFQFFNGYIVTVIWLYKFPENLEVKYHQLADLLQKHCFEDFCNVHKQHNLNEHVLLYSAIYFLASSAESNSLSSIGARSPMFTLCHVTAPHMHDSSHVSTLPVSLPLQQCVNGRGPGGVLER